MGFGQELSLALGAVPHTKSEPNPGNLSYGDFLEAALLKNPAATGAGALQAIANAGWNASNTYGSKITNGIKQFPKLIDCLKTNGYI